MDYDAFCELIEETEEPVILVEGTRNLLESDQEFLMKFAARLATLYPDALFRTGNATGSDEAFASGIKEVDPSRLQYVLPYARHRQKSIDTKSFQVAITDMPAEVEDRTADYTRQSSPQYTELLAHRNAGPRVQAKARYLLRDTIKVTGAAETTLRKATVAIFYVNADNPMKGGTGHTIRVCRKLGVPVVFQDVWMRWPVIRDRE